MAYVEIDTEYGPKGHSLKYSTIKELTEEIVERYSNYHIMLTNVNNLKNLIIKKINGILTSQKR